MPRPDRSISGPSSLPALLAAASRPWFVRQGDMGELYPRNAEGHRLLCAFEINPLNIRYPTINARQVQAVWPELVATSEPLRFLVELEGHPEVHEVTAISKIATGGRSFCLSLPSKHRCLLRHVASAADSLPAAKANLCNLCNLPCRNQAAMPGPLLHRLCAQEAWARPVQERAVVGRTQARLNCRAAQHC